MIGPAEDDGVRRGRAAALFVQAFGHEPDVVGFAPGRVNLIGEHTDYNGGLVLPVALAQGTTCAVARRDDARLVLVSSTRPGERVEVPVEDLARAVRAGWWAYAAGAFALSPSWHALRGGVSMALDGDLPLGAGLSSSASLECAVLVALAALAEDEVDPLALALVAQRAEHAWAGVPCGVMDQAVAMLGREGCALLLDSATYEHQAVPLNLASAGAVLLVVDTRVHHELSDGGYAARRGDCERAAQALGAESLVDAEPAAIEQLPEPERRRARHVVTEQARVREAVAAFERGDLAALGPLFAASHASLRDDFEVSCPELDLTVSAAMAAGALASRMTGGGFGGSTVSVVPVERVEAVVAAVREAFARAAYAEPGFLLAHASDGARVLAAS